MIMYIRQSENIKFLHKAFNIFKVEKPDDKTIIYLPINEKSNNKKIKKVIQKLSEYLYNNNIKAIALEQNLMKNEDIKNIIYQHNINILDGTKLDKFLVYNIIQKIYQYKRTNIQAGEITLLINENDDVNLETIIMLAKDIKRLNIITNDIKKFRKIVDYLYKELGILIKLSNNIKTNLRSSDVVVNIDFPEEMINKLEIPNNAIILNIPKNINIKSKKFSGINIKGWEIEVPDKYVLEGFNTSIMYEASLYTKPVMKVFEQIQNDDIKIKKLIGVNGVINAKEFI